jgi:REP element-mobilizing transposase RayT
LESLQYCQEQKGLTIYAWVLMSNHLHTIVSCEEEWMLDKFAFRAKNDKRIKQYKFWQDGNGEQIIFSYDYLMQKLNYIHNNPVKAEFVDYPEQYRYSSAVDYAGGNELIK